MKFAGRVHDGMRRVILAAAAMLCCTCAGAETQVYLLRGWFGVFSTGMDDIERELRAKGVKAEAIMHFSSRSTVAKIVKERKASEIGRLALVGHSQGANNVIEMARELRRHGVPVDLLITLVPFMQDPIPSNVVRAVNYYQSPGWGMALTGEPDFKGTISNIDIAGDWGTFHITIDKTAKVQAEIVRMILALQ
jgi:hypothetical protein